MSRLKRSWIVMANVALMAAILVFDALYSGYEKKENYEYQVGTGAITIDEAISRYGSF